MFKNMLFICFFLNLLPFSVFSQNCIIINQQPEDHLTIDNDDFVLTIDATSPENLTFQWQLFNKDIGEWDDITDDFDYSGTNTDTLTITNVTSAINQSRFRVLITGISSTCFLESDEAVITYAVIKINNLFTPNGDGINELFIIEGLARFPTSKLQIYNRWGNLIYEKINYQNDWDGVAATGFSINGSKKMPTGTYFYTIDLKFDNKRLSGWIYINR